MTLLFPPLSHWTIESSLLWQLLVGDVDRYSQEDLHHGHRRWVTSAEECLCMWERKGVGVNTIWSATVCLLCSVPLIFMILSLVLASHWTVWVNYRITPFYNSDLFLTVLLYERLKGSHASCFFIRVGFRPDKSRFSSSTTQKKQYIKYYKNVTFLKVKYT